MDNQEIDAETGEILKAYETEKHLGIKTAINEQIDYVRETLRSESDPARMAKLSGDVLSMVLIELTAFYEYLSGWLANESLHVSDLKTEYDLAFAKSYLELKKDGYTNETARMQSKLDNADLQKSIDKYKHGRDVVDAWKHSMGRYIDAVRSQLSYEKQQEGFVRNS